MQNYDDRRLIFIGAPFKCWGLFNIYLENQSNFLQGWWPENAARRSITNYFGTEHQAWKFKWFEFNATNYATLFDAQKTIIKYQNWLTFTWQCFAYFVSAFVEFCHLLSHQLMKFTQRTIFVRCLISTFSVAVADVVQVFSFHQIFFLSSFLANFIVTSIVCFFANSIFPFEFHVKQCENISERTIRKRTKNGEEDVRLLFTWLFPSHWT